MMTDPNLTPDELVKRCAECDCSEGGIYCNWIGPSPQIKALIAERDALKAELAEVVEAENARLREALKASREVHCGIAEHILERGKYPADGPVDTKGIFADSQRARLGVDAALRAMGVE